MSFPFAEPYALDREARQGRLPGGLREPEPLAAEGGITHPRPMPREAPSDPPSLYPDLPPGGPLSDEPQMETDKHVRQLVTLLDVAEWAFLDREDVYFTGNMTIFFSPEQIKRQDFRGPDFFVVIGTDRRSRNSWVVWQEGGRFPDVIIELLSKSTRANDLGPKKQTYQDVFRTPEYYAYDPEKGALFAFALVEGRYERRMPDARGWVWSERLAHYLGVREGLLRLFTPEGEPVPTALERGRMAEAAQQRTQEAARKAEEAAREAVLAARRADEEARRADEETRRADEAEQQVKRLTERLRALGLDPEAPT